MNTLVNNFAASQLPSLLTIEMVKKFLQHFHYLNIKIDKASYANSWKS